MSTGWHALTVALNDLSRSMGVKDVYPFVLSPAVHEKLRFVHDLIRSAGNRSSVGASWLTFLHRQRRTG